MLALFIAVALAKPDPSFVPPSHPTLYGAPILSVGIRGTFRTTATESAGLEARLDSVVFVRARLSMSPSITRAQHARLREVIGFDSQRPWWGRQLSLEAAWAPIPNIRIGGAVTDDLSLTRRREERLQVSADKRGQSTVGPIVAAGLFNEFSSLHVGGGYRVPVAVKRGQIARDEVDPDARGTAGRSGSPEYFMELEGRVQFQRWVASADVSVRRTRRSRDLQELLDPEILQPTWSDWEPSITLGASYLF